MRHLESCGTRLGYFLELIWKNSIFSWQRTVCKNRQKWKMLEILMNGNVCVFNKVLGLCCRCKLWECCEQVCVTQWQRSSLPFRLCQKYILKSTILCCSAPVLQAPSVEFGFSSDSSAEIKCFHSRLVLFPNPQICASNIYASWYEHFVLLSKESKACQTFPD